MTLSYETMLNNNIKMLELYRNINDFYLINNCSIDKACLHYGKNRITYHNICRKFNIDTISKNRNSNVEVDKLLQYYKNEKKNKNNNICEKIDIPLNRVNDLNDTKVQIIDKFDNIVNLNNVEYIKKEYYDNIKSDNEILRRKCEEMMNLELYIKELETENEDLKSIQNGGSSEQYNKLKQHLNQVSEELQKYEQGNKYQQTHIYELKRENTDLRYVGHTTQNIKKRFSAHKSLAKRLPNSNFGKLLPYNDFVNDKIKIYLLTTVKCRNLQEAETIEKEWMNRMKANVNIKMSEWRQLETLEKDNNYYKEIDEEIMNYERDDINNLIIDYSSYENDEIMNSERDDINNQLIVSYSPYDNNECMSSLDSGTDSEYSTIKNYIVDNDDNILKNNENDNSKNKVCKYCSNIEKKPVKILSTNGWRHKNTRKHIENVKFYNMRYSNNNSYITIPQSKQKLK